MIEVDPINQCLSKCRLGWFVPGVEELGSRSSLYCGAVWSGITLTIRNMTSRCCLKVAYIVGKTDIR